MELKVGSNGKPQLTFNILIILDGIESTTFLEQQVSELEVDNP